MKFVNYKNKLRHCNYINFFLIIYVFIGQLSLFSQNNETSHWNFGEYAGLDFTTPQTVQTIQNSAMLAPGGSASISNDNGDLLFYTNSEVIWDRNNNIMTNGSGLFGNKNALQNSIIVPVPNSDTLYYLFTVGTNGFHYSTIDISLNNGLGAVTNINTALLTAPGCSKLTAVHHSDGESVWVMTTKENETDEYTSFYAYKINTDGSISEPVITDNVLFRGRQKGMMKFSPNGERMAISNFIDDSMVNHLFLFRFNNETGAITNKLSIFTSLAFFEVISAYGIEFSSDSNILYVTLRRQGLLSPGSGGVPENSEKRNLLYQYNLENNTPSQDITILSDETGDMVPGSLQLAKNGKIYRALLQSENVGENKLGVINNPNEIGLSSSYNHAGVNLLDKKSSIGLPNFIQSYFRTRILNQSLCQDESVVFEIDSYSEITAAQWDFGDGNTSNELFPNHSFSSEGNYNVSVTLNINNKQVTTSKQITVHAAPNLIPQQELIQCDDNGDGISVFNLENIKAKITNPDLEEQFIFYETIEDAEQNINPITNPQSYTNLVPNQEIFTRVINYTQCYSISSFFLNAMYVELLNISDFYVCEDSDGIIGDSKGTFSNIGIRDRIREELGLPDSTSINLYPSLVDAQTTQNEIRTNLVSTSTTIWVRAEEDGLECSGLAPINLIVNNNPVVNLYDSYTFCQDAPISLYGHSSNDRYEWIDSNGTVLSTLQQFTSNTSGTYTHIAYRTQNGLECSNSKTFTLIKNEAPVFETIDVDFNYNNNTIYVEVIGNSIYEFSTDNISFEGNSNSHTFYHIPSGLQKIYVRDIDQCEETIVETLQLIGYPKFFTPNNDGINDFWSVKGADDNTFQSIQIYNRYGKLLITLNQQNMYRWDGRINNNRMPSDDYWFKVDFKDGSTKMGHFTLKN